MLIYLSGEENHARPEVVLGKKACLMMTYIMLAKMPKRFKIIKAIRERERGITTKGKKNAVPRQ